MIRRISQHPIKRRAAVSRGARAHNQQGATLIESLVAVAIMMIMVVGIMTAAMTGTSASTSATLTSRLNALATAFGEAVKALPYQSCVNLPVGDDLETLYQQSFEASESQGGSALRDLQDALGRAVLEVVDATPLNANGTAQDACADTTIGLQQITVEVRLDSSRVQRTIVKRDPALDVPLDFWPITNIASDTANTPLHLVGLDIGGTASIERYEWWCLDTDWADPGATPPGDLNTVTPPAAEITAVGVDIDGDGDIDPPDRKGNTCVIPKQLQETEQIIVLRVWTSTGRVGTKFVTVTVPMLPAVPDNGVTLTVTSSPECLTHLVTAGVEEHCSVDVPITFLPYFSEYGPVGQPEPDQRPAYKIDFGDGRVLFCQPALEGLPTACQNNQITHTFASGGAGRLVVIERLGIQNPLTGERFRDALYLTVLGADVLQPTAVLATDITTDINLETGQPGDGENSADYLVAPNTTVTFDATASHAAGQQPGTGIASFIWDFNGDGTADRTTTSGTTAYTYPAQVGLGSRAVYEATVTVVDTAGVSNSTTVTVVVDPLSYPVGLFISPSVGRRQCGFLGLGVCTANIRFNWTAVPRLPGDRIRYGVRVSGYVGVAPFYACFGLIDNNTQEEFWFDDLGLAGSAFVAPLSGNLRFCAGASTTYEVRTERYSEAGTLIGATPWSPAAGFTLTG